MKRNLRNVYLGFVLSALIASWLLGCGGSGATRSLIVADAGNNRVLMYSVPFSTDQAANIVLGQADFIGAGSAATATGMNFPIETAMDSDGNLYVADWNNCRVLQFKPSFSNGMSANVAVGKPDFTSTSCVASATVMGQTSGVKLDANGNMWVSDSSNNRLVQFRPPFSTGMTASLVIGQADFTSAVCNQGLAAPTASTLCNTRSVVFDSAGNMWVADTGNNRVLQFRPPFTTGMAASLVLGQPGFITGAVATTAPGMNFPTNPVFDSAGNLWISDFGNNRILEFMPPFSSGMSANVLLGQVDFTHGLVNQGLAAPTAATLNGPHGLSFDSSGNLLVSDEHNNRTLIFAQPLASNMSASTVIGQADFTHNSINQGAASPSSMTQDQTLDAKTY